MIICCWSLVGTSAWGQNAGAGRLMKPSKSPANMIKTYQCDETIQTSRHQYDWNIHPYSIPPTKVMEKSVYLPPKRWENSSIRKHSSKNSLCTFQNDIECCVLHLYLSSWAEGSVLMWTLERLHCSVKPGWPCLFARPVIPHSPIWLHQSWHCTPCLQVSPPG